jgi:hypothetical protein
MAGLALGCVILHVLSLEGVYGKLSDSLFISPYWTDASKVHTGLVPYRDFALEYPPLSLVAFLLPAILPGGGLDYPAYRTMFEALMALAMVGLVPVVGWTVARVGGGRGAVLLAVGFLAAVPLLFGPLTISRYDPWPALLTAAATLAMVSGRPRLGFALLALGTLAKVYPIFLAPLFAWYAWRRAGRREALGAIAVGAAAGLAGLVPFLAIDPGGTLGPFSRTLERPLQVESLGASVLMGLRAWFGLAIGPVSFGFDSYNLIGPYTADAARVETSLLLGSLVVLWGVAVAGPARPERFVGACAAALALTVALGKVLSPQYDLWLVAAVAATASRSSRGIVALAAILVLTQVYFPGRYLEYLVGDPGATLTILERNLALLGFAIYLAVVTWRPTRSQARAPAPPPDPRPDRPSGPAPAAA